MLYNYIYTIMYYIMNLMYRNIYIKCNINY